MSIDQYMANINGVEYVKWEYHKNVKKHLLESIRKVMVERDELKAQENLDKKLRKESPLDLPHM